jgi:hypothetical protein
VVRCHPQGSTGVGTRVLWPSKDGAGQRESWGQIGIEIFAEVRLPSLHRTMVLNS